jgi:hypothetical protein
MAMAYDAANNDVLLFGGQGDFANLHDTWAWDGKAWTRLHPAHWPRPGDFRAMAYDQAAGQMVLVVSSTSTQTWVWDGSDWIKLHPAHSPAPGGFAMAYDAAAGQVVLFGGSGHNGTWAWDGSDWTELHPAHSPSPRTTAMAYDPSRHDVVLFGGQNDDGTLLHDTWTWQGTDWVRKTPLHSPPARYGIAMSSRSHVMLFAPRQQTWIWDGVDWTRRWSRHAPPNRHDAAMTYDLARGEVVLFGGTVSGEFYRYRGDTWTWDGADWSRHLGASMILDPSSGRPGKRIYLYAWGFGRTETVQITFIDSVQGDIGRGTARSDSAGGFQRLFLVPPNATPGVQLVQAKGMSSGATATQAFRVR